MNQIPDFCGQKRKISAREATILFEITESFFKCGEPIGTIRSITSIINRKAGSSTETECFTIDETLHLHLKHSVSQNQSVSNKR